METATWTIPTQLLNVRTAGGLYSALGRTDVGLIETDIDDLTATVTSRADVVAAAECAVVAKSIPRNGAAVKVGFLRPQEIRPRPRTLSPCFHHPVLGEVVKRKPVARAVTLYSPTQSLVRYHNRQKGDKIIATRGKRALELGGNAGAENVGGLLEASARVKTFGADEREHREILGHRLRRLRGILGEPVRRGKARSGSPHLLSVDELRELESVKRRHTYGEDAGAGSRAKGPAVELAVNGNRMLRGLAKTLVSSIQRRIQEELLRLGFRKWQARPRKTSVSSKDATANLERGTTNC